VSAINKAGTSWQDVAAARVLLDARKESDDETATGLGDRPAAAARLGRHAAAGDWTPLYATLAQFACMIERN